MDDCDDCIDLFPKFDEDYCAEASNIAGALPCSPQNTPSHSSDLDGFLGDETNPDISSDSVDNSINCSTDSAISDTASCQSAHYSGQSVSHAFNSPHHHATTSQAQTSQQPLHSINQQPSPGPSQYHSYAPHSNLPLNHFHHHQFQHNVENFNPSPVHSLPSTQFYRNPSQFNAPFNFTHSVHHQSHQTSPGTSQHSAPNCAYTASSNPRSSQYHSNQYPFNPYSAHYNKINTNWNAIDFSVGDFIIRHPSEQNIGTRTAASFDGSTHHPFPPTPSVHNASHGVYHATSPDSGVDLTPQPVRRAVYKKEKGKTSQMCRKFPDILPEDRHRTKRQNTGKDQLWFFVLQLLGDVTKKSIIAWTGVQRHFRVKDTGMLCHLWSEHNGRTSPIQWESLRRTMRTCGANGILMAVPSTKHKGMNEEGVFGFVIEPAFYLNMTRQELDRFIEENCETVSATVQHTRPSVHYSPY